MKDTASQFSPVSVALHWLIALAVIGMLALGIYMKETESYGLYDVHKSIGVAVLVVALIRLFWRLGNGWPAALSDDGPALRFIARLTHWMLIIVTLLMPVSGALMSVAGGRGLSFFGFELMAANRDPANPDEVLAYSETLADFAHETHEVVAFLLIFLVLLHLAGALKHQLVNKDATLRRMFGGKV